jgi:hypothetical protein
MMNVSVEWVESDSIAVRSHVKMSVQRSAILIGVFGSFPHSLQTNARIVFQTMQRSFSATFFPLTELISCYSNVYSELLTASLNKS